MIEDFVLTETPPLADELHHRFVAVQRDRKSNRSDLLSVTPDNQLALFRADENSQSSWAVKARLVPGAPQEAIEKLLAFSVKKTLHALAHYPDPLDTTRTLIKALKWSDDADGWEEMDLPPETKNDLERTSQMGVYEDAHGNFFIYAVSHNYSPPALVVSKYSPKNGWVNIYRADAEDPDATLRFVAGQSAKRFEAVEITGKQVRLREAKIVGKKFSWTEEEPTSISLDVEAGDVFSFSGRDFQNAFMLLSNDGRLFLVDNYRDRKPNVQELTGTSGSPTGLRSVRTGVDVSGRTMVFAIDDAYRLWLLRQEGGRKGSGRWVELGDAASAIACPVAMADGAETFVVGVERDVSWVRESRADGLWTKTTLDRPKILQNDRLVEPRYCSSYAWEVSATDKSSKAAPGAVVEVTSDVSTNLSGNGLTYVVDPNHPAVFATDETGKLYLEAEATELRSPKLSVHVPGGSAKFAPIRADGRIHARLAGNDKDFDMSADAMRAANMLPAKSELNDKDADAVVSAIRSTGGFLQAKHEQGDGGEIDASVIEDHCWQLTATEDGGFSFKMLTDREFDRMVASRQQSGDLLSEGQGTHIS